jgi:ribosomal protein S21
MVRRFTQKVRESGVLIDAKKSLFFEKKQSRPRRRVSALERVQRRHEKWRLKKLGKI